MCILLPLLLFSSSSTTMTSSSSSSSSDLKNKWEHQQNTKKKTKKRKRKKRRKRKKNESNFHNPMLICVTDEYVIKWIKKNGSRMKQGDRHVCCTRPWTENSCHSIWRKRATIREEKLTEKGTARRKSSNMDEGWNCEAEKSTVRVYVDQKEHRLSNPTSFSLSFSSAW